MTVSFLKSFYMNKLNLCIEPKQFRNLKGEAQEINLQIGNNKWIVISSLVGTCFSIIALFAVFLFIQYNNKQSQNTFLLYSCNS